VNSSQEDELIGVAHDWDRAMVGNNVEAIGRYMADDLNAMYIRSEEAVLRARFGDRWSVYQGSVQKWL
jgi:protein-S-isoprenylcysteine O-methyltransferase Ste14